MRKSTVRSLLLLLLLPWSISKAYKPVFIVHGLFDGPKEFRTLAQFIEKAHPGSEVTVLDLFDDLFSLRPLWTQVKAFRSALEPRLNQTKDGAHLLCFSQGGVICRALLSVMPNHNIHTFIALSSPLAGQYGAWKENFLKIKKMVLIGGPDDGVITPWQSSHFGFYNSKEVVKKMKKQPFYRKDSFGLKTLDARGDIAVCKQSGVKHTHWHNNQSVFTNCIRDWLI